jgi:hypothetical protein
MAAYNFCVENHSKIFNAYEKFISFHFIIIISTVKHITYKRAQAKARKMNIFRFFQGPKAKSLNKIAFDDDDDDHRFS